VVPSFTAKTLEGREVKLADFRGKPVLLAFWGQSVGYSTYDFQMLRELQASHGAAGRLAILGCNMDADRAEAARFAQSQRMTWSQVYLGDGNQTTIPGMFGINGNPGCVLIDAEGRLASAPLRGSSIRNVVNNAVAGD